MKGSTVIKSLASTDGSQTMINERDKYVNFTLSGENSTMATQITFYDFEGQEISQFTVSAKFNIIAKNSRISKIAVSDTNSYNLVLAYKVFEVQDIEPFEVVEFRYA